MAMAFELFTKILPWLCFSSSHLFYISNRWSRSEQSTILAVHSPWPHSCSLASNKKSIICKPNSEDTAHSKRGRIALLPAHSKRRHWLQKHGFSRSLTSTPFIEQIDHKAGHHADVPSYVSILCQVEAQEVNGFFLSSFVLTPVQYMFEYIIEHLKLRRSRLLSVTDVQAENLVLIFDNKLIDQENC